MKSTDQYKEQENQKSNSSAQALIDATRISQGAHKVIAELHAATLAERCSTKGGDTHRT